VTRATTGFSRLQGIAAKLGPAGLAVGAAGVVVNALGYVVPLLAARRLSAADLSALATVVAIGAIATVPGLGLQAAIAVRLARHGRVVNAGRATLLTAGATAAALLVATPIMAVALRISAVLGLLLVVTNVAVVIASRWLGELQGEQRFAGLAVGMVLVALARYGGVIVALLAGAGVTESFTVGAIGAWVMLPFVALVARRRHAVPAPAPEQPPGYVHPRDVVAAGGATLAMLAISYADLILARSLLPAAESGAYAVGSVLTKGALWAPQVVTVMALPRLARGSQRTLVAALAVVAGCGVALVGAALVAGDLAMRIAGGPSYTFLGPYAVGFAAVGALYALVFVFVNAEIAAHVKWPAAPLWIALIGMTIVAQLLHPPTLKSILVLSMSTAAVTTIAVSIAARHRNGSRHAAGKVTGAR
jgi:O-antigen/teichoic acid export membrane protein